MRRAADRPWTRREVWVVGLILFSLLCADVGAPRAEGAYDGLPVYHSGESGMLSESDLLVGTPGTTESIASGLYNPAAFSLHRSGGLFLSWQDLVALRDNPKNWLGILSIKNLAFAVERFQLLDQDGDWDHLDEYTMALSWGDRRSGQGIAYSWKRGGCGLVERHKRLTLGSIRRWDWLSIGTAGMLDLQEKNHLVQADIGVRPLGPRLTLFADAVYRYEDEFEDLTFGYGLEVWPLSGLSLSGKFRDDGDYSVKLEIGFGRDRLSGRMHLDKESEHLATTYAVEMGRRMPALGHGLFGQNSRYPELSLKGPTVYRTYEWFDDRRRLLPLLATINHWANDPTVGGIVLNASGIRMNPALLWEVREQLAGFRAKGKTITVYFDRVWMGSYMLASVADEIWMDPAGDVDFMGMTLGRTYMTNMLAKLGLGFDELRFFTYKSALEGFSRTSMSDADREQIGTMLDDWYETFVGLIGDSRGLSRDEIERIMNEKGALIAQEAREAGLVDSLGTYDQAKQRAKDVPLRDTVDHQMTKIDGVSSDPVWSTLEWGEPPHIAVIYGIGVCAMEEGIKGPELAKTIKEAGENPQVKAIVFRADSPGGDPLPSDLVSRAMKTAAEKKPVIVTQGMVAGSGGYWISMYGDSIVASPFTVTGSIGVIGGHIWNKTLGAKLGLDYDYVKKGEHSDLYRGFTIPFLGASVPHRPLTSEERDRYKEVFFALYDDFVGKVAEGRGMEPEEVDKVGQGRIWSGTRGLDIGLVDEIGGLWESIRIAKSEAGLEPDARIRITEGPSLGKFQFPSFGLPFMSLAGKLGLGGDRGHDQSLLADGPYALDLEDSMLLRVLGPDVVRDLSAEDRLYLESLLQAPGQPLLLTEPYQLPGE